MKKLFMVLTLILFASLGLSGNGQEQGVGIEKTIIYRVDLCLKISLLARQVDQSSDTYTKHKQVIDFCNNPLLASNPVPTLDQLNSAVKALEDNINNKLRLAIENNNTFNISLLNTLKTKSDAISSLPSVQKGIGLPSEAAIIIGLADFLISRVKAEISMSFAADLSKWIKGDPKLSALLSNTSDTLANLDALTFKSILPTLREAIIRDFDKLPETITHPIFESSYFTLARRQVLAQVARLLSGIRKGQDPIAALSKFADIEVTDINDNNTRLNFVTLGLLAREINYYQLYDFKKLLTDSIGARLCLRFIEKDLNVNPGSIIKTDAATFFMRIINMFENVQDIIDRLNATKESSDNRGIYIAYVRAITDILELSQKIFPIDGLDDILAFMRRGADIQEALVEKNYNRLIAMIIDIIKPLTLEPNLIISKQIAEKNDIYEGLNLSENKIQEIKDKIINLTQISIENYVKRLKSLGLESSTINCIANKLAQNLIIPKQLAGEDYLYEELNLPTKNVQEIKAKIRSLTQKLREDFINNLTSCGLDKTKINLITTEMVPNLIIPKQEYKNLALTDKHIQEIQDKIKCLTLIPREDFFDSLKRLNLDMNAIDLITAKLVQYKKGSEKIFKMLAFAANLASAKTSEDVQKALEAAADPVGSYRAKRAKKGGCYFTINGYFGASMPGLEWQGGNPQGYLAKMSVPLGMEFGWSLGGGSVGIFGSFLDLGNIAYYRIKTEGSSENENASLGFDQIFAPGCFIIFGVSNNYPISYGVGYQYLPKLQELSNDISRVNVHRFSFFIGIDLALFRF